jgi:hypothetical protein
MDLKQQHVEEPNSFRHIDCEIEQLIENDEAKIESITKKLTHLQSNQIKSIILVYNKNSLGIFIKT